VVAEKSPEGVGALVTDLKARAQAFIEENNYHEAENIYCAMDQPDLAIAMYNVAEKLVQE